MAGSTGKIQTERAKVCRCRQMRVPPVAGQNLAGNVFSAGRDWRIDTGNEASVASYLV